MAETMIFKIRHADGTETLLESHANGTVVTSAKQTVSENNQDVVKMTILSAVQIALSIGDSIDVFGRRYWINQQVPMTKVGENNYKYDPTFEGIQYQLARSSYDVNIDPNLTNADLRSDSLTGDLRRFVSVLILSSNDGTPGVFEMGDVPEDTETKTLTFGDGDNCLSVAQRLSQEYNLPLSIDPNQAGTKYLISYGKETNVFGTQFKFGAGKGIYELKRDNVSSANIVNKLKVRGGTKNITNKYRCLNLLLPNKNRAQSYIVDQDSIDHFGVWTGKKTFTDIYPHRTGTVTAIDANDVQNFVDSAMDFDLNDVDSGGATKYLIEGLSPKIHFNSGNLAGYEFDIVSYNHTTKTFRIKKFTDEAGLVIPSDTSNAFKVAVGDEYVILDINMPDSYIEAAEEELEDKAEEYLAQNSVPKVKYSLTFSELFIKALMNGNPSQNLFWIGDFVPIKDDDIGVDKAIRITGITRDLLDLYNYGITISDIAFTVSIQTRIISDLIEHNKIIQINELNDPARARRNWKDAQELIGMVFDPDGYFTDKIRPASIETIALTVGAKSMQFGLVGTVFQPNYGGNGNRVVVTGGTLVHYTIDDQQAVSWTMQNGDFTMQSDSGVYYIYAKCSRTTNAGQFVFSTDPIKCESDPNYYYFWVGVLHSKDANTGTRAISLSYGFTQINGRYITTGRIQSADGNNYIDLDENKIRFGNQSCYIDWNVTQNGQFSLRNVKVVSGSGDAWDIPVYRGAWSSTATYYSGDEVDYTSGGKTITYRYINQTATSGHLPTETAYWKPVATGKDGADGQAGASGQSSFKAFAFKRTNSSSVSAPTGGSYASPTPTTTGWSDGVPSGDAQLWMTTRIFTSDGASPQESSWSTPRPVTDTADIDFEYSAVATNPGNPTDNPSNWHDAATSSDIWMAVRKCKNGTWGSWEINKIKGEKGDDGTNGTDGTDGTDGADGQSSFKSTVFRRVNAASVSAPTGGSFASPVPTTSGWSDGIPSGDAQLWMSTRIFTSDGQSPQQSAWTTPRPLTDTADIDFEYSAVESNPGTPTSSPNNWHNTATSSDIWMAVRKCKNGEWGSWDVTKIKGEKGDPGTNGTNGTNGSDGDSIQVQFSADTVNWHSSFTTGDLYMRERVGSGSWSSAIRIVGEKGDPGQNGQDGQDGQDGADGPYKSFVFKPATTKPSKPTGTSPVPSGWYDAPPNFADHTPTFTGNWTVNGKRIVSDQIDHSESTWEKIQITTSQANTVVALKITASSEPNYDKGYICGLDADQSTTNYLARVSGVETSTVFVVVPTAGTHFFWVGYVKDSSAVRNNDNVTVTVLDVEDITVKVWMSCALVTGGVAGTWSDPIAINGVDGVSPSSPFRGDYDSQTTYYGSSVRTDIVKYNGAYYRANPNAPSASFSGHAPTDEAYWQQFGATFENLATGFFFAQEAVIDNAVVRILRTADSGKRIEIQNNEMSMYDASGVQKLNISGDDIDIGTPTASYKTNGNGESRSYNTQGGSGQDNFSFDICTFTVPSGGSTVQFPAIHIQSDVYQQYYGGGIVNLSASIQVLRGSTVVLTLGTGSWSSWGDIDSNAQSASLSAGTYTIRVAASYEWFVDNEPPYWNEVAFSLYDKTTGSIVVASSTVQAINIGANGIAIHLGNSFSAVFALNNGTPTMLLQGLNSSNQTVGLRVTSSGVQINRGSGWTSL